jgi:hypothetical protein
MAGGVNLRRYDNRVQVLAAQTPALTIPVGLISFAYE